MTQMPIPPKNKHIFGVVTLGEKGQIVSPKKARDTLILKPGDSFIVLGDTNPGNTGIALIDSKTFLLMTGQVIDNFLKE